MVSVMSKLKKTSIKVSDIAAQYWCERQMELNYLYGAKITKEIKKGKAIHEALEGEANVPIMLQPRSYADSIYKSMYTSYVSLSSLREKGKAREIQIYGSINGYKMVGRIDQLEIDKGDVLIVEDKTKANGRVPSDAQLSINKAQLLIYRKMLEDIAARSYGIENFNSAYQINKLVLSEEFMRQMEAIGVESRLREINAMASAFFKAYLDLGRLSDRVRIRYIDQSTHDEIGIYNFDYNKNEVNDIITYVLKYWNGECESRPVAEQEKWKCKFCAFFGKECKVYWPQKGLNVT